MSIRVVVEKYFLRNEYKVKNAVLLVLLVLTT
jgi:hypothetical protein